VLIAQAAGIEHRALIGEILSFAIRRYQERERERERARRAQAAAEREHVQGHAPGEPSRNGNGPTTGNGAPA
jgi:D-alanine-D-alanine ligase